MINELELFTETVDRLIAVEEQLKKKDNISLEDISDIETELSAIDFQIPGEYRTGISLEAGFFKNVGLKIKELWDAFVEWIKGIFGHGWRSTDSGIDKHTRKKITEVKQVSKNAGKVDNSPIVGKDNSTPITGMGVDVKKFTFGRINIVEAYAKADKSLYSATMVMVDKTQSLLKELQIYGDDITEVYKAIQINLGGFEATPEKFQKVIRMANDATNKFYRTLERNDLTSITTPCTILEISLPDTRDGNVITPSFTNKVVVNKAPRYKYYGKTTHNQFDRMGVDERLVKDVIITIGTAQKQLRQVIDSIEKSKLDNMSKAIVMDLLNKSLKQIFVDTYRVTETAKKLVKVGKEINAASHKGNAKKGRVKPFCK